ncbi:hypothetical protein BJY01DRAFT_227162 [Aspergillus pseudoustus]|uniref:RNase MRP protein 1 RNA binding domain-containing protein n=1 Tax=Aspergillus pseudoustus TaxID=1810923 RepID=A0ABR4IS79_9EURO
MEEDEILRVHSILHLIFHRNKNQHRRSKWWKWLSILKRTVWSLAQSLSSSNYGNPRPAKFYTKHLTDRVIPRCYAAFSVVIADVQFSPLGAILVATLGRLAKATGIDRALKSCRQRKADLSSQNDPPFCKELSYQYDPLPQRGFSFHAEISGGEDVGQALSRDEQGIAVPLESGAQNASQLSHASSKAIAVKEPYAPKQKKPKKNKKKNAIDDLFDGLL